MSEDNEDALKEKEALGAKGCPYCGSAALTLVCDSRAFLYGQVGAWRVICCECGAAGPHGEEAEAVAHWNTRVWE